MTRLTRSATVCGRISGAWSDDLFGCGVAGGVRLRRRSSWLASVQTRAASAADHFPFGELEYAASNSGVEGDETDGASVALPTLLGTSPQSS